jgi:hypothetical protein
MNGHGDGHTPQAHGRQPRDGRGRYEKHGIHTLKKAVQTLG